MARWSDLGNDTLSVILVGDINLRNVTDPSAPSNYGMQLPKERLH